MQLPSHIKYRVIIAWAMMRPVERTSNKKTCMTLVFVFRVGGHDKRPAAGGLGHFVWSACTKIDIPLSKFGPQLTKVSKGGGYLCLAP